MRQRLSGLAAWIALAAPAPALAVEIPLPAGAVLAGREIRGEDRLRIPVGPVGPDGEGLRAVEGFVSLRAWRQPDMRATPLRLLVPIRAALMAEGFEPLFDCTSEGCGGVEFRFAAPVLPAPFMRVDVGDMAVMTLSRAGEAGESYVSLLASRVLGAAHLQVTLVEPGGTAPAAIPVPVGALPAVTAETEPTAPPAASPDRDTPPAEPAPPDPAPASVAAPRANGLYDELVARGQVSLGTVDFESGGSGLLPSSAAELDAVAAMMAAHPDLAVEVVGHSDASGNFDVNMRLSRARAETVVRALIARGVPEGRLQAHAVGPLAPATTNRTAEGRAINRRVVLVERP